MPQQSVYRRRVRELGCTAESAKLLVERARQGLPEFAERSARQFQSVARSGRFEPAEDVGQLLALAPDFIALLTKVGRDTLEELAEGRHAVASFVRKIGPTEERPPVLRVDEHGQWPAAGPLRQELLRRLVDLVDVGAFLAVNLYVDEQLVHQRAGRLILERLVRHDVAPVTRGVADREQHRFVLLPGEFEGFVAPWVPVNRVVGVLQQVRAGLGGESIRHDGDSLLNCRPGAASQPGDAAEHPPEPCLGFRV